jgi:hypothetical protein
MNQYFNHVLSFHKLLSATLQSTAVVSGEGGERQLPTLPCGRAEVATDLDAGGVVVLREAGGQRRQVT